MLAFFPEFNTDPCSMHEVVLVLDESCSMKGEAFEDACALVGLCVDLLDDNVFFNVAGFGDVCDFLFARSRPATPEV